MKRLFHAMLAVGSVLAAVSVATASEPLRLDVYLSEVRANHPAIQGARLRAAAQSSRIDPAGTWDDPFVAIGPDGIAGAGGEPELIRYQVSQTVPFYGKRNARRESVAARALSAAADADTITREVVVIATQTFYQALYNQRAIELNNELRGLVEEAIESGKARYRTGALNHHEWLLAKAEQGVFETDRVRLVSTQTTLHAQLNELRSQPPSVPIERVVADLPDASAAAAPEEARAVDSPELRSLQAVIAAADEQLRAARLAYFPDLVLQGVIEQPRGRETNEPMWGMMAGISLPIFWYRKQDELRAAALKDKEAAMAEKQTIENRLATERTEARQELRVALETAALYEKSILPSTELALESARAGYATGGVSLPELIVVARAKKVQALEYLAARIDVELAKTRFTEVLSAPPLLRLAPATPTLFAPGMAGAGMSGGMAGGSVSGSMRQPSAIRMGSGVGLGMGRGTQDPEGDSDSGARMGGM